LGQLQNIALQQAQRRNGKCDDKVEHLDQMIMAEFTGHAHNSILAKAGGELHVEQTLKLCPPSPILPRYEQC
jgi:hypothetical protein